MNKITHFFSPLNKKSLSWAFYDWANSAFATTVMAAFFPVFFKQYWSEGIEVTKSTFVFGTANSIMGLFVALLAPILGAVADQSSLRMKFLISFTFLGGLATGGLYFVGQGQWLYAITLYALAAIGFAGSLTFYDSLLLLVCKPKDMDFVSSFGFALGYLGGALLFTVNVLMYTHTEWFGIENQALAIKLSFLSVAVWWLIFTLPIVIFVKEPPAKNNIKEVDFKKIIQSSFKEVFNTFTEIKRYQHIFFFLLAYFFYIDGVNTTIKMAVDYGMSIGFEPSLLIKAILLVNFFAFPATLIYLALTKKLGTLYGILIAIGAYCCIVLFAYFMQTPQHFILLSLGVGSVQGGIQALSRSYYGQLIPPDRSAEFFGFYNMLSKFSSILGPFLMGTVGLLTKDPRLSILSVLILFIIGGSILVRKCELKPKRD
ncbi:MAG: MFS transporter [Bdellovibrionales bacterium]|nr:MFS transporter [Bdellovibrionales bacterium]